MDTMFFKRQIWMTELRNLVPASATPFLPFALRFEAHHASLPLRLENEAQFRMDEYDESKRLLKKSNI